MLVQGMSSSKIYKVWSAMKARCNRPSHKDFKHYGGRGIRISKRWHTFKNFYKDMGDPPKGLTLERINNEKGYSKSNCKWVTRKEQIQNRRVSKVCSNGHKRTEKNTYNVVNEDGYRVKRCRECNLAAYHRRRQKGIL